jgi:hypothetical protein
MVKMTYKGGAYFRAELSINDDVTAWSYKSWRLLAVVQ